MADQNFKNHGRFVPGFHFGAGLMTLGALILASWLLVELGLSKTTLFFLFAAVGLILVFWYARAFGTGNQDRIIRAEENFRTYRLTGKMLDSRLTTSQIVALRFADDDDEYKALTERAIKENLSAKDIKQAITQWKADHHRI